MNNACVIELCAWVGGSSNCQRMNTHGTANHYAFALVDHYNIAPMMRSLRQKHY